MHQEFNGTHTGKETIKNINPHVVLHNKLREFAANVLNFCQ